MAYQKLLLTPEITEELKQLPFELFTDVKCISKRLNKYIIICQVLVNGTWYKMSKKDFNFLLYFEGTESDSFFTATHTP